MPSADNLNKGLIYTNENCIGCNRCISACPVLGANISKIENGRNRIYVDGEMCIHCGKCLESCRHNAREYRDDLDEFIAELEQGEEFSLIVDHAFFNNYPEEADHILGYLQTIGVKNIYDSTIGADIVTWAYIKYLSEHPMEGAISNPCPAIVNYIVKYKPELVNKLVPIHSPAMATAIFLQKYKGEEKKLAYIGPCIAKKDEVSNQENCGYIRYNVTIQKLLEHFARYSGIEENFGGGLSKREKYYSENFSLENCHMKLDEEELGLGVTYSMAGGLSENMVHFLGYDALIRTVDGKDHAFQFLDDYEQRMNHSKQLPFLVDIMNCNQGCICGTGMEHSICQNEDIMFRIHDKRQQVMPIYNDGESPYCKVISREERRMRLYHKYGELHLEDFLRDYRNIEYPELEKQEIKDQKRGEKKGEKKQELMEYDEDAIFNSMYKYTEESRCIDCHSCGYDSCREMVKAIAYGYNYKKNCVHYVKDENLRLYLTDTLSGIPNTNAFMKRCGELLKEGKGSEFFSIYFNIRNMKLINRKYGSKTGDIILADYAKKVNSFANEKDGEIVARWGGDNFVALFKKYRLSEILNRLDNVIIPVIRDEETEEECRIPFRAAIYELTGKEKVAGQVMGQITTTYATIKQSKSNIIYFDEQLGKKILHNTMVEDMLEPALKNREFVVYYQPKVNMKDNCLIGAEALVRWHHNDKLIPPNDFIPICENNGFVQKIDFYVLEQVCKDMREWMNRGIDLVKISFNFSKQHFTERHVAERINRIADKYGIPKQYLEVEFTETAYIDEFDNLVETIDELHDFDIYSSIDDFGTGYSSLSLLQNIRFNTLKLDKSFLNKYANNNRNKAVVANIIHMAKELDMDIVAEGIETSEEFRYLKMLSCDIAQGYLFDRPLPKEQFEERLKEKHYSESLIGVI